VGLKIIALNVLIVLEDGKSKIKVLAASVSHGSSWLIDGLFVYLGPFFQAIWRKEER
jgi:hypothetical protein